MITAHRLDSKALDDARYVYNNRDSTDFRSLEAAIRAYVAATTTPSDGRNKLVIDAYRAMDAIDAIRRWCDEQPYENDITTVSRLRAMLPPALSTASGEGVPGMVLDQDEHHCPICAKAFEPADLCATDIEMGTCHAVCLEGSPTVDLETGEPIAGPIPTYRYDGEML